MFPYEPADYGIIKIVSNQVSTSSVFIKENIYFHQNCEKIISTIHIFSLVGLRNRKTDIKTYSVYT